VLIQATCQVGRDDEAGLIGCSAENVSGRRENHLEDLHRRQKMNFSQGRIHRQKKSRQDMNLSVSAPNMSAAMATIQALMASRQKRMRKLGSCIKRVSSPVVPVLSRPATSGSISLVWTPAISIGKNGGAKQVRRE
jgi:hypothetical protein